MKRVAIVSDIHANLPALEAALADIDRREVDTVVVAGDLVGDGKQPAEVVTLLRRLGFPAIRGNVDRKVAEAAALSGKELAERARKKKTAELLWTARRLDRAGLHWLTGLPATVTLLLGGARMLVVHGSPLSDTDSIYPSLTPRALAAKLGADRPDILVCGHSHVPFARRISGVAVVNAGSVGRPVDGDPRGSYALVDIGAGRPPRGRIVRFSFPTGEADANPGSEGG
jgi:putative phosphoesterase